MKKLGYFISAVCLCCWLACSCHAGKSIWEGTVGTTEARMVVDEETGRFRLTYGDYRVSGQFYDCFPTVSGGGRVKVLDEAGEVVDRSIATLKAEQQGNVLIGILFIPKECLEISFDLMWKETQ